MCALHAASEVVDAAAARAACDESSTSRSTFLTVRGGADEAFVERDPNAGCGLRREWADETYEKGETQSFYNEFFDIFGVRRRTVARYEEHVQRLDNTSGFIDLFWPGILLVEQKSAGRDLAAARDQAGTYFDALSERDRPRYQLLSDFQTFELLDRDEGEETRFLLSDLPQHVEKFGFHHRRAAPDVPRPGSGQHRRVRVDRATARCTEGVRLRGSRPRVVPGTDRLLPVRDDTGIFEPRDIFLQFIEERTAPDGADLGAWLMQLFEVLNTPVSRRQRALDEDLAGFPHVNGELFAGHLRGAVPVGHGARRPASPGGTLHDRKEHPEGDRATVSRRPAGGVPAVAGSPGRAGRGRSSEVPGQARFAAALRPGLRLRQLS